MELTISSDLIGGGKAIDLQFSARELSQLLEVTELTKAKLAEYPGVIEITDTFRGGKPEINLALTSEGEALGFTMESLGRQVRQGFFGEEAQRTQRGRDEIRVMVRYPQSDRRSLRGLEQMRVRTPTGDEVPFSTVAAASTGFGPASITRVNRSRAINVQAEVDESITTGSQVLAALQAGFLPELMERYPGASYSLEGTEADFQESVEGLIRGLFIALFVMFAMLAIPLKSYVKPGIILSAIPFGMVGAVWGHWLFGLDIGFLSLCGMVALAGVVVNDGLVLVSFMNNYGREQGFAEAGRSTGWRGALPTDPANIPDHRGGCNSVDTRKERASAVLDPHGRGVSLWSALRDRCDAAARANPLHDLERHPHRTAVDRARRAAT